MIKSQPFGVANGMRSTGSENEMKVDLIVASNLDQT